MSNELMIKIDEPAHDTCPAGTHNGVCAMVYNLGTHTGFNGKPPVQKMGLVFEVQAGRGAGTPPKTYQLCKIVNASLNEKSVLRQVLTACRGDLTSEEALTGIVDLDTLVGKPCTITVSNKAKGDKTVALIDVVTNHMSAMPVMLPTVDKTKVPDWVIRFRQTAVVQEAVAAMTAKTS